MENIIPNNKNIAMAQTVKGTEGTGMILAPRPFSPLKIKSSPGGARRALTFLGTNNAKANLSLAQSYLALTQDEFRDIWNFDPLNEEPLTPGRYQWEPISSQGDREIPSVVVEKEITLLKDITNPILASDTPSEISELIDLHKANAEVVKNSETVLSYNTTKHKDIDSDDNSDSENRKVVRSSCENNQLSRKRTLSKSQKYITEFFRPQKRKSSNQCEETLQSTPAKKKIRTIH